MLKRTIGATVLLAFSHDAAWAMPAQGAGNEVSVAAPGGAPPADVARDVSAWVASSGDNAGAPFIIIDKVAAKVLVFDSKGQLVGATAALLGSAVGDDSAPGVGERKLSAIRPEERTTPAGRFVARIGRASGDHEVLWVDYTNSVSLHPLMSASWKERRAQRLRSPAAADNRITYGCINVSPSFYANVVRPLFGKRPGIVYILPETRTLNEVFPTFRQMAARSEQPYR